MYSHSASAQVNGLLDDMKAFLCSRYWLPKDDFPYCPDVFSALRLTGDDSHEFMDLYATAFQVDLSEYVWPKYHLSESEAQDVRSVLRPFMRFAGIKTQPLNRDLIPVSIDHLLRVAQHGRWFDPADDLPEERPGLSKNISRFGSRLRAGGVPKKQR